jgi:hypothetical protein
MVPKVLIRDLYNLTFRRSTLITIPEINDFFEFNEKFSGWQVFSGIVQDALDKYQYYYPLHRQQRVFLDVDINTRHARIFDNFEGYLEGKVGEDQIVLIPNAVMGLAMNAFTASGYPLRNFRYETGLFTDVAYARGIWWMDCICNYPLIEDYDIASKEPTDKCAIYFMEGGRDSRFKILKDQVYVELVRYISNMRKNMMLTNLPVEFFQGLEEDAQRVTSDLERIYEQALTSSAWLL